MFSDLYGGLQSGRQKKYLLWAVVFAGVALRLFHFLDNRSLWEDEVFLASSLIRMDFFELATLPLDYQQRAPIGYLWMTRLCVVLFGNSEMSLRLFPLLCSIASILVFIPVARFFLRSETSVLTVIFIVAFAPPVVYHAVEAKQYGAEFFCTVLALYLYTCYNERFDIPALIIWGLGGALILWFSFSSLFVLAGMAGAISLTSMIKKDWRRFFLQLVPFLLWLVSFGIQYKLFISKFPEEEWLVQFWRNRQAFLPFPPKSGDDLLWPLQQIYSLVRYPMGLSWFDLDYAVPYSDLTRAIARFLFLPIALIVAGLCWLFKNRKATLLLFSLPVLVALAASSLELYPLRERLTLFLAPIFILTVGMGIELVQSLRIRQIFKTMVVLFLLAAPLMNSATQVVNTEAFGWYKHSNQREAMTYINNHYRPGDVVYVYWNDLPSFRYYQQACAFDFKTIYGSDERATSKNFSSYLGKVSADIGKTKGYKRLWYVYRPYNGLKIGDIEFEPRWYYHDVDAAAMVLRMARQLGKAEKQYPSEKAYADVKVCLITLQ